MVQLKPIDCGPLSREEFGVVFTALRNNERRTYFVKGRASNICPKIMETKVLAGRVSDLCENYTPEDQNECIEIKEFVFLTNSANK